ncbi:VaFE repeat-containing surface-anchored protein, partial [Corynebacterium macginleyi]|uniref:VaFE repeat-containing surface-anchored protein n=1 Tax=Corynebacterium macginleyi TaxID=38290 RepID=UPI00190939A8
MSRTQVSFVARLRILIAVIAALTVIFSVIPSPSATAQGNVDSKPTDFKPDNSLGGDPSNNYNNKNWGSLLWAGAPPKKGFNGHPDSDVGWAWCIDPHLLNPTTGGNAKYLQANAVKLEIRPEFRDAVINLALKWQQAIREKNPSAAATYVVYMIALTGKTPQQRTTAAYTITGQNPSYQNLDGEVNYKAFKGSLEEFTELTGLELLGAENSGANNLINGPMDSLAGPRFKKVAEIASQPESYYITIVPPKSKNGKRDMPQYQRVLPPDQPGLPDIEEDKPEESPTPDQPSEEQPTKEQPTTQPSTEPTESTPTTSASEKELQPKIRTKAEFVGDAHQVVAGAKIVDEVSYEGLVPGKEYTLKAELISKKDEKTVLGTG